MFFFVVLGGIWEGSEQGRSDYVDVCTVILCTCLHEFATLVYVSACDYKAAHITKTSLYMLYVVVYLHDRRTNVFCSVSRHTLEFLTGGDVYFACILLFYVLRSDCGTEYVCIHICVKHRSPIAFRIYIYSIDSRAYALYFRFCLCYIICIIGAFVYFVYKRTQALRLHYFEEGVFGKWRLRGCGMRSLWFLCTLSCVYESMW